MARIFNTYGPGMRLDDGRVMTEFITAALAGRPLRLDAGGEQTRSFCYIDDMLEGLVLLMGAEDGYSPINIGTGEEVTLLELAQMVIELLGSQSKIITAPRRADDPMKRKADNSMAEQLLCWRPKTPLNIGVKRIAEHIRATLEAR